MNAGSQPVLSRHRLRQPYRLLLVMLWLLPIPLLIIAVLLGKGITIALFDPRLLLPFALMALPALYVWQEGVDAHPHGITTRIHVPRYHRYDDLAGWRLDEHREGHILTIWKSDDEAVLSYHAAHLTDLPALLDRLEACVKSSPGR